MGISHKSRQSVFRAAFGLALALVVGMALLVLGATSAGALRPALVAAYEVEGTIRRQVGILDAGAGRNFMLTRPPLDEYEPEWNPEGTRLLYRTFVDHGRGDLAAFDFLRMERFQLQTSPEIGVVRDNALLAGEDVRVFTLGYGQMWLSDGGTASRPIGYGFNPRLSPDGVWLLYYADTPDNLNAEIYVWNMTTYQRLNLSQHPAHDWSAAWSPDGAQIVFVSARDGNAELYIVDVACAADYSCPAHARRITHTPETEYDPSWSPDGAYVLYTRSQGEVSHLFMQSLDSGAVQQLTSGTMSYRAPALRP